MSVVTNEQLIVRDFWAKPSGDMDPTYRDALIEEIRELLVKEDAVIVAHYYTDPEIQALAEATGGCVSDSLEMARFDYPLRIIRGKEDLSC